MEWNVPSTVWLNHHTCFQPATWMPETYSSWEHIILYAKIIAVHVHVHLGSPLIDGIFLVQKMCIYSCVTLSTTLLITRGPVQCAVSL